MWTENEHEKKTNDQVEDSVYLDQSFTLTEKN